MIKHTPGPWHVETTETRDGAIEAIAVREGSAGLFIAAVEPHDMAHADAIANARLIAAAPDLLAALERIATYDGGAGRIARDVIAKVQS
jgi:hypothetical protein